MDSDRRFEGPDGSLAKVLILGRGYCGTALAERPHVDACGPERSWRVGEPLGNVPPRFDIAWFVPPTDPGLVGATLDALLAAGGRRAVYVSSTSVYGQADSVATALTPRAPTSPRGRARAAEEDEFLRRGGSVVRLPGIYGPGRSIFDRLSPGYRLVDGGRKWSARIHRDDVAMGVEVTLRHGEGPYLLCDDEGFQVRDLVAYACGLTGAALPESETLAEYAARRGEFAASFWRHSNRYDNTAIASLPGFALKYPTFRDGLAAIHAVS